MTKNEVYKQIDLAMYELQSINLLDFKFKEFSQKRINKAYNILDKLKQDLKSGGK